MKNCQLDPIGQWSQADTLRGREAGTKWAKRRLNSERLERLAREYYRGPGRCAPLQGGPLGNA